MDHHVHHVGDLAVGAHEPVGDRASFVLDEIVSLACCAAQAAASRGGSSTPGSAKKRTKSG